MSKAFMVSLIAAVCSTSCSWDWNQFADHKNDNSSTCATGVSDERVARLRRGIDLYGWLESEASFSDFISDAELGRLAKAGVTFIRASFYAPVVFDPTSPEELNESSLAYFRQAVTRARNAGLGIVFVPYFTTEFKQQLGDPATQPRALDAMVRMWSKFGEFINEFDPNWVFPELVGAPDFVDSAAWNQILAPLAKTVRLSAPAHTIIADGNSSSFRVDWNSTTALSELTTIDDERNVIYGFIFFDPVIFTHQGASFRPEWQELKYVRGIPYPSSPTLVAPAQSAITDIVAYAEVAIYGNELWDADKLSVGLDNVAKWAEENCARVMCVEFGAYRQYSPKDSVARWVTDTRTALEARRIAWSYWSYNSQQFGLLPENPGPVIEPTLANALGLAP